MPPKKAGVFRSVVNIKLIAKSGGSAEKTVVLVTTDPSIMKLAATTKLPVTKDLQTAPVIPKAEETESAAELKKAISETILKIAESAALTGGKEETAKQDAELTDIALLQRKVERKRALDRLKKNGITIDLGEMEETEED